MKIAFFGGIYSNYLALDRAIAIAHQRKVDQIFALGDFGAFGPHPDRTVEILRRQPIGMLMGNYEESLSTAADDCHCGYTDPRDTRFAQISYDYTAQKTAVEHTTWMATLPRECRITVDGRRILMVHGSPRRINEFLWESNSPVIFLEKMMEDYAADILISTHTGLHWQRRLPSGKLVINCGALGRPANDGKTNVWFALLAVNGKDAQVEFVPVGYDHERLAREMEREKLPREFIETIRTGWWTTCLEILPAKERARGRF